MKTIRTQRTRQWYTTTFFKMWVIAVVTSVGVLYGAVNVETIVMTRVSQLYSQHLTRLRKTDHVMADP